MENDETVYEIIDAVTKTQGKSLCLASLDLDELPTSLLTEIAPKVTLTVLKLEYNDLCSLPEEIGVLSSLEELYLTGNQLACLPGTISDLRDLKQLHINENCIKSLPESFGELHNLQVLNLIGNELKVWRESFGNGLKSLAELRLGENRLQYLPESFTCLKSLKVLEINDNDLKEVPKLIGNLSYLQVLNLNQNDIEDLPDSFSHLSNLYSVDISENHVKSLPREFKSANVLQYFYAVNNLIKVLPPWFEKLNNIVELNLSDNELTDMALPPEFCLASCKTLTSLDLSGNKMTVLPETMGELKRLKTFHLGSTICELERRAFQNGNWLKQLPDTFTQMTSLTKLHLDENQIICLPDTFGDLVSLEWLDLSQNRIQHLPESFCSLKNLWFCQFSKNNLTELPENFGDLTSLVELRLDSNNLTDLPKSFERLQNIELVDLFCNKFKEIPKVLLKLKKLQRLDLDGNRLKIKEDKVPKLSTKVQYAPRNPDLKDNWRGKARVDKQDFYGTELGLEENISSLLEKAELDDNQDLEESETDELVFNERALEMAMRKGLSIWRSHTGPQAREEDNNYSQQFQTYALPYTFHPCQDPCNIFEDALSQDDKLEPMQSPKNHNGGSSGSQDNPQQTEDWDKEVEDAWQHNYFTPKGLQQMHPQHSCNSGDYWLTDLIFSYPPAKQAYTNSAKYDSVYKGSGQAANLAKIETGAKIVEINSGQFEDAEI